MYGSRQNRDPMVVLRAGFGFALGLLVFANVGCQCLGPTSTCLRTEGPILSTARRLREQHLERSQYTRVIPEPQYEQQTVASPSRFHPVPTHNVFQGGMMPTNDGIMPMLVGPDGSMSNQGGTYQLPLEPYGQMNDFPLGTAPSELQETAPPIYQPQATPESASPLNLNSPGSGNSNQSNDMEELPMPNGTEIESDPVVPPELDRPENQNDKVTHRDLILYPYTLDVDRPYSDWVRGVNPKLQSSVQPSPSNFKRSKRSGTAASVRSGRRFENVNPQIDTISSVPVEDFAAPAGFQLDESQLGEFGPPIYAEAYSDRSFGNAPPIKTSQPKPAGKILKRVTSYGPTLPPTNIEPAQAVQPRAIQSNGVPYIPSNDPTHPMFRSNLPFVQLRGSGQPPEPVQMHSAMQQSFEYDATRLR